ncbi:dual specificity protein phosphatase family protein [Herpetosiphon gulosus]|uniref:Tyrosine specific protein phosphatases domain-containing protein n=1 Tax=Herpetosiphon gulosus TaxID=1973496 RepID=A0ABP9X044_9CHLR
MTNEQTDHSNWPATPIAASYWVLPERLLAGEHPMLLEKEPLHERLQHFSKAKINVFIDLTEQTETQELGDYSTALRQIQSNQAIVRYHFPIPDMSSPSVSQMRAILAQIIDALDQQQNVYVHCWGGLGRTGTIIGCLLVEQGWEYTQALTQITRLRQATRDSGYPSPSNDLQRQFVADWQK